MNSASIEAIYNGFLRPYEGTNYQLCEYDVRRNLKDIDHYEDPLYEMKVRHIIPVIAHVERYFPDGIDLTIIQDWFDCGFIIQVNRTSLNGKNGKTVEKNAWKVIEAGLAHLVASDAHTPNSVREPRLDDAWQLIADKYGEETADILLSENPNRLLEGKPLKTISPQKKKKLFFF